MLLDLKVCLILINTLHSTEAPCEVIEFKDVNQDV